jgi:hypothetical protein
MISFSCHFSPAEIASGTHEPRGRSGPYRGEKNLFLLQEIEPQFLSIAADCLIALLTELSTVLICLPLRYWVSIVITRFQCLNTSALPEHTLGTTGTEV